MFEFDGELFERLYQSCHLLTYFLGLCPCRKVCVIGMNDNVVWGSSQEWSPVEEGVNDGRKFNVFDWIVSFCIRERL